MTAAANATGNNVQQQRVNPGLMQLNDLLQKAKSQIALALPKHLTPERMIRMAMTLYGKNDQLKKCDPMTIVACVIQSSELGLELSSPLGHAYMVPYGNQATFQIGYKGFFELAFRSGKVSAFPMRTVHANDRFKVAYGTDQKIIHEPAMKDRGDVIGYYACIYLRDGGRDFEWMSVEDAQRHRDRFAKNKGPSSPWSTSFDAMAMKSAVRMLAKRVPISTELNKAAGVDESQEAGQPLDIDFQDRGIKVAAAIGGGDEATPAPAEYTPAPQAETPAAATLSQPPSLDAEFKSLCDKIEILAVQKGVTVRSILKGKKLFQCSLEEAQQIHDDLVAKPDAREPGSEG